MAEDIKSLTKKCADLEKRLRFSEAKIKVLADTMTNARDIEKYLDVLYRKVGRERGMTEKAQMREMELQEKATEAREKEREREWDKEWAAQDKMYQKEMTEMRKTVEKIQKDNELKVIQARLSAVEAMAKAALSK